MSSVVLDVTSTVEQSIGRVLSGPKHTRRTSDGIAKTLVWGKYCK